MNAAAEVEKIARRREAGGQLFALRGAGAQYFFDFGGDAAELFNQLNGAGCVDAAAQLAELEREQKQSRQLGGESLGGGDADLRAGMGVDGAMGLARYHGVDHVADGDGLRAEGDHLALRG